MAITPIYSIRLPAVLPKIVITRNAMKVIGEYKTKVNSFPLEINSFDSKKGKSLDAMLYEILSLQRSQESGSEAYCACDSVINEILIRLPKYFGEKPKHFERPNLK
jgi:hypothetical protein